MHVNFVFHEDVFIALERLRLKTMSEGITKLDAFADYVVYQPCLLLDVPPSLTRVQGMNILYTPHMVTNRSDWGDRYIEWDLRTGVVMAPSALDRQGWVHGPVTCARRS